MPTYLKRREMATEQKQGIDWKSWKCELICFVVHERCSRREKFGYKRQDAVRTQDPQELELPRSWNSVALIGSDSSHQQSQSVERLDVSCLACAPRVRSRLENLATFKPRIWNKGCAGAGDLVATCGKVFTPRD